MRYQIEKEDGYLTLTNGNCDLLFGKDVTIGILIETILEDLIEEHSPEIRSASILEFKAQERQSYCKIRFELDDEHYITATLRFSLKDSHEKLWNEHITVDDNMETIAQAVEDAEQLARIIWAQTKEEIKKIMSLVS